MLLIICLLVLPFFVSQALKRYNLNTNSFRFTLSQYVQKLIV